MYISIARDAFFGGLLAGAFSYASTLYTTNANYLRMTSFICICTLGNIYVAIFAIFYIYKLPKDCTIDSILITQQTSQL